MLNIPQRQKGKIFNALLLIKNGSVIYKKNKSILPNYGVFDEKRYFSTDKIDSTFLNIKKRKLNFLYVRRCGLMNLLKKTNPFNLIY